MNNNEVTIRFSYGVKVQHALSYAGVYEPSTVKKLTVTGSMTNNDFRDIIDLLCKTLIELDLNSVSFEKDAYLWSHKDCPFLTSVAFPASINRLDPELFARWSSLTHITVDHYNTVYASKDGILFSKDMTKLVKYPTGRKGHFVIPDTVTVIGHKAFSRCKGLTSVTIPNSVLTIGQEAFAECSGLTSVIIPESVVSFDYKAFYNCTELSSIDMPKSLKHKKNYVFEKCEKLPHIIEERKKEIKKLKIAQLQQTSACDWINSLMSNSKYPYRIEQHHKTKLQLNVMVTNRLKLEIPVPYMHFQTIIPKLMETIQHYEACIKENEIMVFISDTSYDRENWKNKVNVARIH